MDARVSQCRLSEGRGGRCFAPLQQLLVLRVEIRGPLQSRGPANSSQEKEGGGSDIFAAGIVFGNVIAVAGVVDDVETSGHFSRTIAVSLLM